MAAVLRFLGLAQSGGTQAHLGRMIKRMDIDTSHFRPYQAPKASSLPKPASHYLVRLDPLANRQKPRILRRSLIEVGRPYECELCGNDGMWLGKEISLHVDHIDGDHQNNLPDNLRFLCPNCHAQTPNYAGRSKGKRLRSDGGT